MKKKVGIFDRKGFAMLTIHSLDASTSISDSGKGGPDFQPPLNFFYLLSEVAAFAAAQIMPTKAILFTTSATL